MPNRTVFVIVNPASAQGKTAKRLPEIERRLAELDVEATIAITNGPGHAIELAERAAARTVANATVSESSPDSGSSEPGGRPDYDAIVSLGGDGTANEVINGLMRARETTSQIPAMGVVCSGRGNDYAFATGIPTSFDESIGLLTTGVGRNVDVGYVKGGDFPDGRYFGNGMGIGFDTIVGIQADRLKRLRGMASYIVAAFQTILGDFRAPLLKLIRDEGEVTQRAMMVSIMIGRRMGGAFLMTPESSDDDGLFDLCIGGEPNRRQITALLLRFMKGTHTSSRHVKMERSTSLSVEAIEGALVAHADGEIICEAGERLEITTLPGALELICPDPSVQ